MDKPQTTVLPDITPGVAVVLVTTMLLVALVPHPLDSDSEIVPEVNVPLKVTTIADVPKPLVIVAPAGTVQL